VVQDTPIDPAIEKRVREARVNHDKAFNALVRAAIGAYRKVYTPNDLKVLKKHHTTTKTLHLRFVNLDTRDKPALASLPHTRPTD